MLGMGSTLAATSNVVRKWNPFPDGTGVLDEPRGHMVEIDEHGNVQMIAVE